MVHVHMPGSGLVEMSVEVEMMYRINLAKFLQNPDLQKARDMYMRKSCGL